VPFCAQDRELVDIKEERNGGGGMLGTNVPGIATYIQQETLLAYDTADKDTYDVEHSEVQHQYLDSSPLPLVLAWPFCS